MGRKKAEVTADTNGETVPRTGQQHRDRHGLRGILIEVSAEDYRLIKAAAGTMPAETSFLSRFASAATIAAARTRLAELGLVMVGDKVEKKV